MTIHKSSHDFLIESDANTSRVEIGFQDKSRAVSRSKAKNYSDAELYRIVVAKALREGRFTSKAEFDLAASELGTVQEADEVIQFSLRRPGCRAYRVGNSMGCDCGVKWKVADANPPACNE